MENTSNKKTVVILFLIIIVLSAAIGYSVYNKNSDTDSSESNMFSGKIGMKIEGAGISITPTAVLEDSRCPTDVECIQAGTVRVMTSLSTGLGTADQEFILGGIITTEAEEISLVDVRPYPVSKSQIAQQDYDFKFEIKKR
jgi:hypothetical protein